MPASKAPRTWDEKTTKLNKKKIKKLLMYSVFTDRHKILTHFICLRSEKPSEKRKRRNEKTFLFSFFFGPQEKRKKLKVFFSFFCCLEPRAMKQKKKKKKMRRQNLRAKLLFGMMRKARKENWKLFELNLNIVYFLHFKKMRGAGEGKENLSLQQIEIHWSKKPGCNLLIRAFAASAFFA